MDAAADRIGVVADTTTPVLLLVLVGMVALTVANLVAIGPGLVAARTSVSRSLRAE